MSITLLSPKRLLIPFLALATMFVAVSHVEAGGVAGKRFGGFKAGEKFSLTVQSVTSSQTIGKRTKDKSSIPEGIPKFKKGSTVKFVIGRKGELTGPGISIAYIGASGKMNAYAKLPTYRTPSPNAASVFKDDKGRADGVILTFYLYRLNTNDLSGKGLAINRVVYLLK